MEEINSSEFFNLLKNDRRLHENYIINLNNTLTVDISKISYGNQFINCTFKGGRIDFRDFLIENEKENITYLNFKNCDFKEDLYFVDCYFQEITITECQFSKSINISSCNIHEIKIEKVSPAKETKTFLALNNNTINRYVGLIDIQPLHKLLLNRNKFKFVKSYGCEIENIDITNCNFENSFQFSENRTLDKAYFKYNTFDKTNFYKCDFGQLASFVDCDFNGTALFHNVKSLKETELKFRSCKFSKYAYFNNSEIKHLNLDTSKFIEFSSFQDTVFETIFIDRTVFENLTFFDDIKIKRINDCNRRTIRNIKQQLLRSDNNIDYDVFKAYELQAHRLEIAKKSRFYLFNKDWIILKVGSHFSNNGLSWGRSAIWTLIWAIIFYIFFYWGYYNNFKFAELDISKINSFLVGYFRYLNPTDFYNPFLKERVYLNAPLDWFFLLLGKIIIAIGVYETVKSFRKFKK